MFNIIIDDLPSEYNGSRVKTDFKQALKFFKILESNELDEREKALLIMKCLFCFNSLCFKASNDPKLWDFINYYIAGGDDSKGGGNEKVFDFHQDSGRIYSAFMQVYKIDLRSAKMHWWVFLEMFKNLPDGTMLSKVIELRGKKVDPKMDSKAKYELMKLKALYSLKDTKPLSPSW